MIEAGETVQIQPLASTVRKADVVAQLLTRQPAFHSAAGGELATWNALPGTLRALDEIVEPGDVTLETGAGASTVVFAAAKSKHIAVSPAPAEHERIRSYCSEVGIDTSGVEFVPDTSDVVLPRLTTALDVAFVDGNHSFPHPVVDFHYISRLLRVGGYLVLDDVPIPSVGVVHEFLLDDPSWQLSSMLDDRAAVWLKVATMPQEDLWRSHRFNRRYPHMPFASLDTRLRARSDYFLRELRKAAAAKYPRSREWWRRIRS